MSSSGYTGPFVPKPPPTSGAVTRTESGASTSASAIRWRTPYGICVLAHACSVSVTRSQRAATARGSSGSAV